MIGKAKVEPTESEEDGATGRSAHRFLRVQSLDDDYSGLSVAGGVDVQPVTADSLPTRDTAAAEVGLDDRLSRTLELFHKSTGDLPVENVANNGTKSVRILSASSDSTMERKTKRKPSPSSQTPKRAPRFVSYIRRKLRVKGGKIETTVKEINISQDEEDRWASRNVDQHSGGSNSRSSSGGTGFRAMENPNIEVVHDMENEYNPEYR